MALFDDHPQQRSHHYQAEYRCRTRDGSWMWIEDRRYVIARNPDGTVARMIGAHRSIDDKKRLIEQLERGNKRLEPVIQQGTPELYRGNHSGKTGGRERGCKPK